MRLTPDTQQLFEITFTEEEILADLLYPARPGEPDGLGVDA
jgi:hypothetical protein